MCSKRDKMKGKSEVVGRVSGVEGGQGKRLPFYSVGGCSGLA